MEHRCDQSPSTCPKASLDLARGSRYKISEDNINERAVK